MVSLVIDVISALFNLATSDFCIFLMKKGADIFS